MDGRGWSRDELATNLRDIRRVNRFGGGIAAVLTALPPLLVDVPVDQEVTILDLATGSADVPLAVAAWGRRHNRSFRIVGSDISPEIVAVAGARTGDERSISIERFDARVAPFADASFDVVICSLALHHFEPGEAVRVLTEMQRLCRVGLIVNDLVRSRAGLAAAVITSRLLTRNRLTRHDAPLSVRRAYTPAELGGLLERSGAHGATIRRRPLFRMVAVWTKQHERSAAAPCSDFRETP